MKARIVVRSVFAAVWGAFALAAAGWGRWSPVPPALLSLLLAAALWRMAGADGRSPEERRRIGRLVGWASGAEGVAIPVGCIALADLGHPALATCWIALVVGLHFLPLARWTPAPAYYVTGGVLVALALLGLRLAQPMRDEVVCGGSATALWLTLALNLGWRRSEAVGAA